EIGESVFVDHPLPAASEAEVDGARPGQRGHDAGPDARRIGGAEDGQVRHGARDRQILERVVIGAVVAHRDAGVVRQHAHRQVVVGQVGADVLRAQQAHEGGEGAYEGDLAACGKSGGDGNHVLLGNTEIDEAFGPLLGEVVESVGVLQVGGEDDDVWVA